MVVIIGVLIALTLPGYRKISIKTQATAVTNDLRAFSAAFINYNLANSRWPTPTGNTGEIPPEMNNGVSVAFTKPSPIGGKYEWLSSSGSPKAAIAISTDGGAVLSGDLDLLDTVDRMIDDGDLNGGSLQLGAGKLIYVIEK